MGQLHKRYLNHKFGTSIYGCSTCKTHLASNDAIVSKQFHGQHGRAFLFNKVINVIEGPMHDRRMTTGLHTIRDIYCLHCEIILGWKYERAYEESQHYKVGKYILEKQLILEMMDED